MHTSRFLVFAATLAFALVPCSRAGVYVKAAGLYNRPGDIEVNGTTAFKSSLKKNTGFSAAVGYQLSMFRAEAELQSFRSSADMQEQSPLGAPLTTLSTTGAVKQTMGFANAYFDFPSFFGVSPYVGAGLGYARVSLDDLRRTRNGASLVQFSGGESVFGYQGMFGLQYHFLSTLSVNAGFRLVQHQDIGVRDVVASASQTLKMGSSHIFELGLALGF